MKPRDATPPATNDLREAVLAILRANSRRLAAQYGVRELLVFGSVVRGETTLTSNVDLVVDFEPERISLPAFLDFAEDLEALLGRRIDIVSRSRLTPRLRSQIDAEAVRVA